MYLINAWNLTCIKKNKLRFILGKNTMENFGMSKVAKVKKERKRRG